MSYLERILEDGEKLLIPNDVELTGQFTATGLQSEPGGIAYYVSSVTGKNDYDGKSSLTPAPSITKALTFCRANKGDTIHCLPGHIETISAAGGLTLSKAGIRVFFHGSGGTKATIQFTATASTLLVTAANVELYSPRFLTGIDAVVAAINPQAADFKIYNAEYYDAAAKATLIQVLTTSAALRLVIDGYKYFVSTTGTQKTDGIKTVGALDGVILKDIDISGSFSVGPLDISTVITNLNMEGIRLNNTASGPAVPAAVIAATTTGFAKNFKARVSSGTTYISSVAKIQWADDCEGFSTDGYGGEPLGTAIATSIEGKLDSIISDIGGDLWSDIKSVISDLLDIHSDINAIDTRVATIRSDLIITHSDVKVIDARVKVTNSDMIITHSDVKAINPRTITIASDLVISQSDLKVVDARVKVTNSDMIITHSDVKMINARSIVLNSDMLITHSDVKVVISDLKVLDAIGDTIKSDLIISHSDIKMINARSIVLNSDMLITHSDVKVVISDLKVADALIDVIKSDLIITHSDVKAMNTRTITIASDLVISHSDIKAMNTRQITIASDIVIVQSDLKIVDRNKDYVATVALVAANMTGTVTRWTIANGPILVKHMGAIITTVIPAGANTLAFSFTATDLAAAVLSGVADTASAVVMQLFVLDGVKVTVLVKVTDPGIMVAANEHMPIALSSGVIQTVFSAGPPATGAMTLFIQYQKLNPAATVT